MTAASIKWLRLAPATVALWFYALVYEFVSMTRGDVIEVQSLWHWVYYWLIANWVVSDARRREVRLWYDSDSFVFLAAPILAPYYLFRTRRLKAFATLGCFIGIWMVARLAAFGWSSLR